MPKWDRDQRRLLSYLAAAACLLLFFAMALSSALAKAPVTDEPLHLMRGVLLRQAGDLSMQGEHGPLSHYLIGLLPFGEQLPRVQDLDAWAGGDRLQIATALLWGSGIDVEQTMVLARLPMIWLGVLLGALAGSWALSWQGRLGLVVTLILCASSPNLIAHAALATTDLPTAATYFATVYAWWRYWQDRRRRWWVAAAVFLGLALATKLTTVLLLPVLLLLALLTRGRDRGFWQPVVIWLGLLPPALLVLWFVYGFEVGAVDGQPVVVPVPSYFQSWEILLRHLETGHPSYFWGDLSKQGWWFYFPVTFLIKTPVVTLFLLLIAGGVVIRERALRRTALFLLVPVGALFAAAIVSRLNIGYRHVLAALPFLLVLASTAVLFLRRQPAGRFALGLILSWMVFSAVWQNPHHLAYFNEALGGMAEGYHYLGDSNLDWGQDIKLLAETIAGEEEGWWVSYYGANDPAYYGLAEEALFAFDEGRAYFAAANPPAGKYAVSANHLQGQLPDADFLDWFRHEEPADQLGGSILIYEIEEQARGDWIAHCLDPAPLLTVEEAETLLGRRQLRHLYFDCRQSFVLAAGGAPGWVVLPQSDSWWFGEQWPAVREGLELVYRHDGIPGLPSFDIVYWPGLDGARLTKGWKQVGEQAGKVVTLPRALNRVVRLAGYQFEGKQWLTLWSISAPTREALSLQAHYFTEAVAGPYIGDSLGFSSGQWQTGDWLLQRFVFPEAEEGLYLETGLYNFQTLEEVGETINLAAEQRQR